MILLKADEGLSDPQIIAALNVSRPCVERIRKRFVADGIESPERRSEAGPKAQAGWASGGHVDCHGLHLSA